MPLLWGPWGVKFRGKCEEFRDTELSWGEEKVPEVRDGDGRTNMDVLNVTELHIQNRQNKSLSIYFNSVVKVNYINLPFPVLFASVLFKGSLGTTASLGKSFGQKRKERTKWALQSPLTKSQWQPSDYHHLVRQVCTFCSLHSNTTECVSLKPLGDFSMTKQWDVRIVNEKNKQTEMAQDSDSNPHLNISVASAQSDNLTPGWVRGSRQHGCSTVQHCWLTQLSGTELICLRKLC